MRIINIIHTDHQGNKTHRVFNSGEEVGPTPTTEKEIPHSIIDNMICYDKQKVEKAANERKSGYLEEVVKRNISKDSDKYCFSNEDVEYLKRFRLEKQLPSLIQQAKNAAMAVKQEVRSRINNEPPVSQEEQQRRLNICRGCEFFTPNIKALDEAKKKQERCVRCGCFMNFKTKLRSQHCPIQKW